MAETVTIIIDASDNTTAALRSARTGMEGLGGATASAASHFGNLATVAGGVIAAQLFTRIASGLQDIAVAAFNAVAEHERLVMTLNTLMAREAMRAGMFPSMQTALAGVTTQTAALVDWTQKLAILSPFGEQDVSQALRVMMQYGMNTTAAKDLTQALVDMSAGSGVTGDQMRLLSLALGQVQARSYLTGEEMRQLTNAGIGVDTIARAMKISVSDVADAIKDKKIAAQELLPALTAILATDFAGAGARMAFSWSGLSSTISDLARIALRTLFTPALEAVRPLIIQFTDRLQDPAFRAALAEIGEKLGVTITGALAVLGKLVVIVTGNWDAFKGAVIGVTIALGALAIIGVVAGLLTGIVPIILLVTAVVGLLGAAWTTNFLGIRTTTEEVFNFVEPFVVAVLERLMPFVKAITEDAVNFFNVQWATVRVWVDENWPMIQQIIVAVLDALRIVFEFVWPYLQAIVLLAWENIKTLISAALDIILGVVRIVLLALTGDWGAAWTELCRLCDVFMFASWEIIERTLNTILAFFGTSLAQLWGAISTWAANALAGIITWLGNLWASITAWFANAWMFLFGASWFSELWAALSAWLANTWTGIITWLGDVWASVVLWFGRIFTSISTTMGTIYTSITSIMGTIYGAMASIWGTISGMIGSVLGTIAGTISSIFGTIYGTISSIMGSIYGVISDVWQTIHGGIIARLGSMLETVSGWITSVKTAITNMFQGVHITLPHFNVSWQDLPIVGRVPSGISVEWYAKGLDAIFSRPTLIGVGEAGAERVQVTPAGGGSGSGATYNITVNAAPEDAIFQLDALMRRLQMGTVG